jgi:hypothetical protein
MTREGGVGIRAAEGARARKAAFFDSAGFIYERAYVEQLAQSGKRVVEIDKKSPTPFDQTLAAVLRKPCPALNYSSIRSRGFCASLILRRWSSRACETGGCG